MCGDCKSCLINNYYTDLSLDGKENLKNAIANIDNNPKVKIVFSNSQSDSIPSEAYLFLNNDNEIACKGNNEEEVLCNLMEFVIDFRYPI